jgi:hypothetical protein
VGKPDECGCRLSGGPSDGRISQQVLFYFLCPVVTERSYGLAVCVGILLLNLRQLGLLV